MVKGISFIQLVIMNLTYSLSRSIVHICFLLGFSILMMIDGISIVYMFCNFFRECCCKEVHMQLISTLLFNNVKFHLSADHVLYITATVHVTC